jgi:hypothetical protein
VRSSSGRNVLALWQAQGKESSSLPCKRLMDALSHAWEMRVHASSHDFPGGPMIQVA